jgi:hypothetical protein
MIPSTPTRSGRLVLVVAGLTASVPWWLLQGPRAPSLQLSVLDLVLMTAAAAVLELLPIRLPSGRALPTSLAVVGAAAILGASPAAVALIAVGGWVLACALTRGRVPVWPSLLRAAGGVGLAGVAAVGTGLGAGAWIGDSAAGVPASLDVGAALAVSLGVVLGVPAVQTLGRARTSWRHVPRRTLETVWANAPVSVSVASTAVLGALVHPVLGPWTLPTMLVPLLAARLGLERLAAGRGAYDQTIRAMSRLPEQLGNVEPGHGIRVGGLATEVALELGLDATTIGAVVHAAHLHELGRIKLEREAPAPRAELAMAGAEVIREVAALDRVASIVAKHGAPAADRVGDREVALPASIVAACCELDRYAPQPGVRGQREEVVVRLVRQVGDLEVVAALTRVLDRGAGASTGHRDV